MTIFFTADTHFGHEKAINYVHEGKKIRPWSSTKEQDDLLIARWNERITDQDTVYHVGDVYDEGMSDVMERLKGNKILIRGNLDTGPTEEYQQYFSEVYNNHHIIELEKKKILLSHYYVTKEELDENKCSINIHGHLHADCVQDPRYFCVSLERTNFYPITSDELLMQLRENQLKFIKNIKF